MIVEKTNIDDLLIIQPKVFGDSRGYFFESYNSNCLSGLGIDIQFIQDNEAFSSYGVLRGLHFQNPPYAQTKLIRTIQGSILDVVVDLRKNSKTYGHSFSIILDDVTKKQLLVPKGFAHGYVVLSAQALVAYKVDEKYMPVEEDGIMWNDTDLKIDWQLEEKEMILSDKDKKLQKFGNFKTPFL